MPYFDTNKKAYYCGKIYRNKGINIAQKTEVITSVQIAHNYLYKRC